MIKDRAVVVPDGHRPAAGGKRADPGATLDGLVVVRDLRREPPCRSQRGPALPDAWAALIFGMTPVAILSNIGRCSGRVGQ